MTSSSDDAAPALRNRFAPPGSPAGDGEFEKRRVRSGRLAGLVGIGLLVVVTAWALVVGVVVLVTEPTGRLPFTWGLVIVSAALLLVLLAWFHAFGFAPAARTWFGRGGKG